MWWKRGWLIKLMETFINHTINLSAAKRLASLLKTTRLSWNSNATLHYILNSERFSLWCDFSFCLIPNILFVVLLRSIAGRAALGLGHPCAWPWGASGAWSVPAHGHTPRPWEACLRMFGLPSSLACLHLRDLSQHWYKTLPIIPSLFVGHWNECEIDEQYIFFVFDPLLKF